jgi:proteasome beta subunit
MMDDFLLRGGIGTASGSFSDLLTAHGALNWAELASHSPGEISSANATTVISVRYSGGVLMVGDRQATEGYSVAHRNMDKVFPTDEFSAVAISGTAGLAIEMVRLFQTELEHYEKLEGSRLSLEGKANYLARLVRQQLPMAFQGLVVVPLFCGFERLEERGRLFTFDVVGGRYEEEDFGATGSGSREAKSYLRAHYQDDLEESSALDVTIRSLVAAAEQDVATGGPDLRRGIFPAVVTITAEGVVERTADEIRPYAEAAIEASR